MTRKRRSWWGELVPLGKTRRRRVKHRAFGTVRRIGRTELPGVSPVVRFPGRMLGRRYRIT